jgi:hypothetical protein
MNIKNKIEEKYTVIQAAAGALSYDTWLSKYAGDRNEMGFAAIYISRENTSLVAPYILDIKRDGWFRKSEGVAKGYGIMLRSIKLSGSKTKTWGTGSLLPILLTYLPHTADEEDLKLYEKSKGFLYVHNSVEAQDVIDYINANKSKWVP